MDSKKGEDKDKPVARLPRGKPTKLTPAVQEAIVQYVAAGNYKQVAAQACGITPETFGNWMKWGREQKKGIYFTFFNAVKEAEARAEASAIVQIVIAGKQDWRADAWFLERSRRSRWGQHITLETVKEMSDEEIIEALSNASGDQGRGAAEGVECEFSGSSAPGGTGEAEVSTD